MSGPIVDRPSRPGPQPRGTYWEPNEEPTSANAQSHQPTASTRSESATGWLTAEAVMQAASRFAGFPLEDLIAQDHRQYRQAARALLYGCLRSFGLSYPVIGELCCRHHTTVMYHLRNHPPNPSDVAAVMERL